MDQVNFQPLDDVENNFFRTICSNLEFARDYIMNLDFKQFLLFELNFRPLDGVKKSVVRKFQFFLC